MNHLRVLVSSIACFRAVRHFVSTVIFFATLSTATASPLYWPVQIEVFAASDQPLESNIPIEIKAPIQNTDLHVYEINGIQIVEADLSANLPANGNQSKRLALQRIQVLDNQTRAHMQRSAVGLAKAMQYGIDRYPAIVIDGQAVVYGVTDLQAALAHYQAWRTGFKP